MLSLAPLSETAGADNTVVCILFLLLFRCFTYSKSIAMSFLSRAYWLKMILGNCLKLCKKGDRHHQEVIGIFFMTVLFSKDC